MPARSRLISHLQVKIYCRSRGYKLIAWTHDFPKASRIIFCFLCISFHVHPSCPQTTSTCPYLLAPLLYLAKRVLKSPALGRDILFSIPVLCRSAGEFEVTYIAPSISEPNFLVTYVAVVKSMHQDTSSRQTRKPQPFFSSPAFGLPPSS